MGLNIDCLAGGWLTSLSVTGNAIGPQVFLSYDAPRYFIAFATHMGCYVLLVIIIILLRWHLRRENKKRDAIAAAGVQEAKDEKVGRCAQAAPLKQITKLTPSIDGACI